MPTSALLAQILLTVDVLLCAACGLVALHRHRAGASLEAELRASSSLASIDRRPPSSGPRPGRRGTDPVPAGGTLVPS